MLTIFNYWVTVPVLCLFLGVCILKPVLHKQRISCQKQALGLNLIVFNFQHVHKSAKIFCAQTGRQLVEHSAASVQMIVQQTM